MKGYSQQELDYAVAQARLEYYQKGYEVGRGHFETIRDTSLEIPF